MENVKPFKEMSFQEKKRHIIDYYKWHIIIAMVILAVAVTMIVQLVSNKKQLMGVLFVNYLVTEETSSEPSEYFEDFVKSIGHNPDKEEIGVNISMILDPDSEMCYQQVDGKVSSLRDLLFWALHGL